MAEIDVFVMCGGKCGGSTLTETCRGNGYRTGHWHGDTCLGANAAKSHGGTSALQLMTLNSKSRVIYVIDSYRNPIERKISSFFQNITQTLPNYRSMTVEELINYFNKNLFFNLENYHPINDVMKHYNIPSFDKFDFENKYVKKEGENIVFVKIRFKDIRDWKNILSKVFNKNITILNNNLTAAKNIYNLYNRFTKEYKVPKEYIENLLLTDKEFTIYNTLQEQKEYIDYWKNRSI